MIICYLINIMEFKVRHSNKDITIPRADFNVDRYLDHTTIVLGPGGTGKSTAITHIVTEIQDHLAALFVVNPTNPIKHDYDGMTPPQAIFPSFDRDWLEKLKMRQEAAAATYTQAMDIDVLQKIFNKIATRGQRERLTQIQDGFDDLIGELSGTRKDDLEATHKRNVRKYMRGVIRPHKERIMDQLEDMDDPPEDISYTMEYLDFNPRVCVVFDDCTVSLRPFVSNNRDALFGDIFYRCRHFFLSIIICLHDDKILDSDYKRNSYQIIFTTNVVAQGFFERASSNFSSYQKGLSRKVIKIIYDKDARYRKLLYQREADYQFQHYTAEKIDKDDKEMVGSEFFQELCEGSGRKAGKLYFPQGNDYSDMFKINP